MKKMVIIFAGLAVIGLTFAGLFIFMKKQMAKIPSMTAKECLDYTLKDKEDAIITIGIIKDGHTSWDVYGKDGKKISSKLHTYEIGSLTKTITATLICKAADEGKICIDDTIDKYLDLPQDKEYPTIADLLTHTSGYKEYYLESPMVKNFFTGKNSFYGISDEMFLKRIARVDVSKADKSWRYSNFGFATLGQILEAVYDCEYTGMANEFLLEQGMGNVGRCGFSVCSRYADHGHVAGRESVPGLAHQADGQAGIVHLHPADSGFSGFLCAGSFRDDSAGSAANGLRDEFVAVNPGPLQGNVAGAGQNAPAVAFQM